VKKLLEEVDANVVKKVVCCAMKFGEVVENNCPTVWLGKVRELRLFACDVA
jgi:hypothetical protein